MDHCDECGFDYESISVVEIPNALAAFGPEYRAALVADHQVLRAHPSPEIWSALEYACHVRDMLEVQRERLALALVADCPTFVPMGRDERVSRDRYNDQDPDVVVDQLVDATDAIATDFRALDDAGWERTGIYNYPAPSERDMVWLARHTIHECRHHLGDIAEAVSAAGRSSSG